MFYLLFVRKNFFDPNLRGGSPGKYGKNMEKLEKYGTVQPRTQGFHMGTVVILARK
jgi:hypothetical protein